MDKNELIQTWLKIGRKNPWIRKSYDPEFDENSFCECYSVDELVANLEHGNWCLGTAFYYKNLCFINQVNGGDEFLVIRDDIPFESYSCCHVIERNRSRFIEDLERFFAATPEQLKNLNY